MPKAIFALTVLAILTAWRGAMAEPPEIQLSAAPGDQEVFVWQRERCGDDHNPDAPARAFRLADGTVRLFASDPLNRPFWGASLDSLSPQCESAHRGRGLGRPSDFDDRSWIAATHTADGRIVHALFHVEFHGHLRPSLCPAGRYMACWMNAIAQGLSEDGGQSFHRRAGGDALVAALPYKYDGMAGRHVGYFSPSNIIEKDGALYVFVFAQRYEAQMYGTCLLRTERIADPAAWRAWDGKAFADQFQNPYAGEIGDPARHVCATVRGLNGMVTSVVRHAGSGRYLALIIGARRVGMRDDVMGVHYATSRDLVTWSDSALLAEMPTMHRFACGEKSVYAYPSLIDGASPSRNFDVVGDRPMLYLTRFNMTDCQLRKDRDLVRRPVSIVVGR